jgi:hypothetical protein
VLDLPVNVPWKLIAASPDMMDTTFGNKRFPFAWRSSLAIYAYEPKPEDMPDGICDQRITYLKVTCSITGYQPSDAEVRRGHVIFPNVPTEELDRIFKEYFACYGVLLNVAVFPHPYIPPVLERKQITIDFGQQPLSDNLLNPYDLDQLVFMSADWSYIDLFGTRIWIPTVPSNNRIVDSHPQGGDGQGELYFRYRMEVTVPLSSRVDARIVHYSNYPVEMMAYNERSQLVDSDQTGSQQGQIFDIGLQGDGIATVVFESWSKDRSNPIDENQIVLLLKFSCTYLQPNPIDQANYPHIIDFEPKKRDLYEGVTEVGEILTASNQSISTGKSFTQTKSSETGIHNESEFQDTSFLGTERSVNRSGSTHSWGQTGSDSSTIQIDGSRERRELESTTTSLTQMYNLLIGYHAGTNRAVFLMLPRPHTLQPTQRATFVQGLRIIEGIQEFFLIVTRPKDMEGLSVEAVLDTGHFPSYLPPLAPQFVEKQFQWRVQLHNLNRDLEVSKSQKVPGGFVVDYYKGDPGHPGMQDSDTGSVDGIVSYNYGAKDDSTVEIKGLLLGGFNRVFDHTYTIFVRSERPQAPIILGPIPFFTTSRGLLASLKSGETCPEAVPILTPTRERRGIRPIFDSTRGEIHEYIADETTLRIDPLLRTEDTLDNNTMMPLIKETLKEIQFAMTTSWKLPTRRPYGSAGFLDSNYFLSQIAKILPNDVLKKPLHEIGPLPESMLKSLEQKTNTFGEIINLDLRNFAEMTSLSIEDAIKARRTIMESNGLTKALDSSIFHETGHQAGSVTRLNLGTRAKLRKSKSKSKTKSRRRR